MTYAAEVLADIPRLFWKLNETSGTNADDTTANNRDGTYQTGCTLNQPGQVDGGGAVLFDGSNGFIKAVSNGVGVWAVGGQRTIEGWFYRLTHSDTDALFGSAFGATYMKLDSGTQGVSWFPDSSTIGTGWAAAFAGDTLWTQVVLNMDDLNHRAELFVNGVSKGLHSSLVALSGDNNFTVGSSQGNAPVLTFNGKAQCVSVTDGLLSAGRILARYNAGAPSIGGLVMVDPGTGYVPKPVKYHPASTWLQYPVKRYNGSAWVEV